MSEKKSTKRNLLFLGFILILGFSLRYYSALHISVDHPLRADAYDYYLYAYNLRFFHCFSRQAPVSASSTSMPSPDGFRTPGYPAFLTAIVDRIPSESTFQKISILQACLSTASLFIAFLVYRSFLSWRLSLGATFMMALSPHLIMMNSYVLSETLFAFMLLLLLLAWKYAMQKNAGWRFVIVGAALGSTALVRPSIQYFPFVLAVAWMICHRNRKALVQVLLLFAGFFLLVIPWGIRNRLTIGHFSDPSLMINFLHHGMYPDFTYDGIEDSYGYPYHFDPRSNEISKNLSTVGREIFRRFQSDPWNHLTWYLWGKPLNFWAWNNRAQGAGDVYIYPVFTSPYNGNIIFSFTHDLMQIFHWPFICSALLAGLIIWRRDKLKNCNDPALSMVFFAAMILSYFTLLHMVGAPFPRYSIPLLPLIYGMGFFTLHYFWGSTRPRLTTEKAPRSKKKRGKTKE